MDLRNVLNGYFEKTPVPEELDPHNASRFVVPNVTEKKEAAVEDAEEEAELTQRIRVPAAESTQVKLPPKSEYTSRSISENIDAERSEEPERADAAAFIKIVRHHKLTGSEFLSILGNSKISNKAYQEIGTNPGLTVKRLIELLEESPLSSDDYERLIIAVQRIAALKAEAKAKIKSEPPRVSVQQETAPKPSAPEVSPKASQKTNTEPAAKTQALSEAEFKLSPKKETEKKPSEGYVPNAAKYYYDPDEDGSGDNSADSSGSNDSGKEKNEDNKNKENNVREERLDTVRSRIQINFDDDNDDNDDDEDEDYYDDEDEYGKRRSSNKGKIAASAAGAVVLIALSFGLRYHLTGSWLPVQNAAVEVQALDEGGIFDLLSTLPAPYPAFTSNDAYSAGGIKEESVFKSPLCGNKRLLYSENNKLYIYEQIGGQVARLEERDYKERTLVGLIEAGDKLAAVSTGVSAPYSYAYTVPAASENGEDTAVTGSVERKETYVEITDADSPEKVKEENKLTLSGTLVSAYTEDNRLILVTWEELDVNSVREDKATFMPYLSFGGNKTFCGAEKVFVSEPCCKGIVTVFSVDLNSMSDYDMAAAAGGTKPLVSKSGNELFIGQDSTLVRYSLNGGVTENGYCKISGSISGFSGINAVNGEIRVTASEKSAETEEYSATLTVLDNNLEPLGEIKNIGKGEALTATCFHNRETYIVTENGTCFGIDGDNAGMSQSSVKITNESVYKYSDDIGIKISASDDGSKRTGLVVSTVRLDGNLTPLYSLEISSKTVAANALDEYLFSPAEEDISTLGGSGENGFMVIPVEYFDGVCQVERFVICSVGENGILSVNGAITEYDRRSEKIFALVEGDVVIAVTKGKIITAKAQDGSVQAYYMM